MTMAATMTCPHCGATDNEPGSQFCEACGMALPSAVASAPRVVDGKGFATTVAGQRLQQEELHKQQKKAVGALLAVAVIQTLVVAIVLYFASRRASAGAIFASPVLLRMMGVAGVFWGLYVWARVQPLPAAIVGLVLYATLVSINVITSIGSLSHGGRGNRGFGGIGVGWVDIVIIAVLSQAISAGLKYRKLMQGNAA